MFRIEPKRIRLGIIVSGAVSTKVFLVFLGYLAGNWLDVKLNTSPLFMLLFIVIAAGVGLWWVFFVLERNKKML